MTDYSPIRDFYKGKSIFITGATGFVGKVIVEKLLRSCNNISAIYLLIRPKKGKTVEQRWKSFVSDQIFKLNHNMLNMDEVRHKIILISGDISLPQLGLSQTDKEKLIENVSLVFHIAADLKFKGLFSESINNNVNGTKSIIDLCHQMKRLKAFVYLSTLAILSALKEAKEEFYSPEISSEEILEFFICCNEQQLKRLSLANNDILTKYKNYYAISKHLAEDIVYKYKGNLNAAIIRPPLVQPAVKEPVPGWVEKKHGPVYMSIAFGLGFLQTTIFDLNVKPLQIPVDLLCNAIIAVGWHLATKRPENLEIYNLSTNNGPTLYEMIKILRKYTKETPSIRTLRPMPHYSAGKISKIKFIIENFLYHWIFAYTVDFYNYLRGNKSNLVRLTKKMTKNMKEVNFIIKDYEVEVNNSKKLIEELSLNDRDEFNFDVDQINWQKYIHHLWLGLRRYILNEKDEDIPKALKRFQKLKFCYRISIIILFTFIILIIIYLFFK